MRKFWLSLIVVGVAFNLLFTCNLFAQETQPRVIEEELVLKDPTVSAAKKWAIGGSIEYWTDSGEYDSYSGTTKIAEGEIEGDMTGGNIFIGYGNWTLQASSRKGDWIVDLHGTTQPIDYTSSQEQEETEITLRYLMRGLSSRHFAPYLIFGYNETTMKDTRTITTAGWIWTRNGTPVKVDDLTFNSFMLGIGAVVPFNKYLGIRGDIRATMTEAEETWDTGRTFSDSGVGSVGFLTGYLNIVRGLNLQIGVKYLNLNGGEEIGWYTKTGTFAMLGYSLKF
jgi:hypothetical protein